MIDILLRYEDGRQTSVSAIAPVHIGRDPACAVRIRHWRVAKRHASIVVIGDALAIEDHGSLLGTSVNRQRIATHAPLLATDSVVIGPCLIQVSTSTGVASAGNDAERHLPIGDGAAFSPTTRTSIDNAISTATSILTGTPDSTSDSPQDSTASSTADSISDGAADSTDSTADSALNDVASEIASILTNEKANRGSSRSTRVRPILDVSPVGDRTVTAVPQPNRIEDAGVAARYAVDQRMFHVDGEPVTSPQPAAARPDAAALQAQDARDRSAHDALLHALDLRRHDVATMSDAALRHIAGDLLMQILREDRDVSADEQSARCRRILDEVVGLGPLETLLNDDGISEIMINRYDEIYIERAGRLHAAALRFTSEQALRRIIDRIVSRVGRRVDESMPMVDARLTDGSRVNAVLPPVALHGAVLTIRKFMRTRLGMADLVRAGALSAEMATFLRLCVARRASIVIAGGTGSGKTTLLNILADAIPSGERIVTIEDSAELRLGHAHLVALEARPPNVEGRGLISIRDLVRNALRMRPDRIVVGECRGAEAFDMLAAMNTGHEGSMTTLHANTPRDALARLETMIMMANMGLPLSVVREHVVSSVDLIVQQRRLADGRRVVTEIVELAGMESGCIQLQSLFRFSGATGTFAWGGVLPGIVQRWRDDGHAVDVDVFFADAGYAGDANRANTADSTSGTSGTSGMRRRP